MGRLKVTGCILACACAVLLLAPEHAQAKGWRRIVPLRSTRAQVERRLGKPRGSHHELKTERAFFFYSSGRGCAGGEGWNVPRDTVVRIVVTPKTKLRLSALRLDMKRFEKSADKEIPTHTFYRDKEAGLTYEVYEGDGESKGLVLHIQYDPTAKDEKLLRCPAPTESRGAARAAAYVSAASFFGSSPPESPPPASYLMTLMWPSPSR